MKKLFGIMILVFITLLTLTGCKDNTAQISQKIKVSFVDLTANNEVLKEVEVDKGGLVEDWTPTKEGYVFDDWYATPSKNIVFDFSQPIEKETTIFGYFTIDEFEVDTRQFYILGSSSENNSVLFGTNWKVTNETNQKLAKSAKDNVNEYSITLDLYVGDGFQFAINNDFNNQRGFGYLAGDVSEWFREEKSYLSNDSKKANILVSMAGNYTFTLVTHPWADEYDTSNESYTEENKENFNYNMLDTINVTRNGDPINEANTEALEIRIKGSYITAWGHIMEPEFTMTYDATNDVYTYSHEIIAGDSFCFYNIIREQDENGEWHFVALGPININSSKVDVENSDVEYLDLSQGNIGTLANGTYSFTYDRKTDLVIIKYNSTYTEEYVPNETWYVAGSGVTEPLKSSQFGYNLTDAQKLTKIADNTYQITLDLAKGDMFQIVGNSSYAYSHSISDLKDPVKDGVEYFYKAEDNMACRVNGNYTITLYLDPTSPLKDYVTWVRNGDIIQEFTADYDVFMKASPNWTISERYTTKDSAVTIKAYLKDNTEFCFIYYDKGVPSEEVGSYDNPGVTITSQMLGSTGQYNSNISNQTGNNNFACLVEGYYTIKIDFSEGAPVVDFIAYEENVPEFSVIIKGAFNGWQNSEPYLSENGVCEFEITLPGGEGSNYEFGFAWFAEGEATSGIGNWVGYSNKGTSGDANSIMVQQANGGNNYVCAKAGTYRIVIDRTSGKTVVNFYYVK